MSTFTSGVLAPISSLDGRTAAVDLGFLQQLITDEGALGVMLYGSHARGSASSRSDVDILCLVEAAPRAYSVGPANVTEYLPSHLKAMAEQGSLFVRHLQLEGKMLFDPQGSLAACLGAFDRRREYFDILEQVSIAAQIIDPELSDSRAYLRGLVRLGTYLLRTAVYVDLVPRGIDTFDLERIFAELRDPELEDALSVRKRRHVTVNDLAKLRASLLRYAPGSPKAGAVTSVEQFAVMYANHPRISLMAANVVSGGQGVSYTALSSILF